MPRPLSPMTKLKRKHQKEILDLAGKFAEQSMQLRKERDEALKEVSRLQEALSITRANIPALEADARQAKYMTAAVHSMSRFMESAATVMESRPEQKL